MAEDMSKNKSICSESSEGSFHTAYEDYTQDKNFEAEHMEKRERDEKTTATQTDEHKNKRLRVRNIMVFAVGSMIADSAQHPYTQLQIGDHTIKALLDSGASRSFITNHCAEQLGLTLSDCTLTNAWTADSQETPITKCTSVPVICGEDTVNIEAFVFPLHGLDMIISYDSWELFNIQPGYAGEPWRWTVKGKTQTMSTTLPPANFLWSRQQLARAMCKEQVEECFAVHPEDTGIARDEIKIKWPSLEKTVSHFGNVLSDKGYELNTERKVKHIIDTGDSLPIAKAAYRMGETQLQELK
ncbi:hypothetical protein H4S08_004189 [Coemansia sp. RSA 1365]|nr:hypothetical protein H4S08_004189 [Coemansia sp. RSA 1365]